MKNKKEPFWVGNGLISRNHLDEICINPLTYKNLLEITDNMLLVNGKNDG